MTDYMFTDQYGNLLDMDTCQLNEARQVAEKLSALHGTDVTVCAFEFRVDRQYCDCGEAMELIEDEIACPICNWQDEAEDENGPEFVVVKQNGQVKSVRQVAKSLWWATQDKPQEETWHRRPIWHYRPTIDGLMKRFDLSRDDAVEVYRERD